MTEQILVPLDGSALAEQAISCATMLAKSLPASIVLLRATEISRDVQEILDTAHLDVEAQASPLITEARDYLRGVADRLGKAGLTVFTVIRCGPAAEIIVDYAVQEKIQQIVMATHGYSGISRWVHGSVAERVIQSANVPVLLVRAHEEAQAASFKPLTCRRILVPLDGSPLAEQVLEPASTVAKALKAELVLFRVPTVLTSLSLAGEGYLPLEGVIEAAHQEAQTYLEQVASRLRMRGICVSTAMQIGGAANAIIDYVEGNDIDLIAMCTHGRTGFARWALGSVTDRVIRAGRAPVLLVRAQ